MLSDGFADELAEIVKSCPKSRQTMLFSATMTDSVDELVKMSLNKPVRLFVDPQKSLARITVMHNALMFVNALKLFLNDLNPNCKT